MFGQAQGAYADKVAANWRNLHALPPNMTFEQGAGKGLRFYYAEQPRLNNCRASYNLADELRRSSWTRGA